MLFIGYSDTIFVSYSFTPFKHFYDLSYSEYLLNKPRILEGSGAVLIKK